MRWNILIGQLHSSCSSLSGQLFFFYLAFLQIGMTTLNFLFRYFSHLTFVFFVFYRYPLKYEPSVIYFLDIFFLFRYPPENEQYIHYIASR